MNKPDLTTLDKLERCLILIPTDFQFIGLNLITELQRYYPDQWKTLDEFLNKQWTASLNYLKKGLIKDCYARLTPKFLLICMLEAFID